MKNRPRNRSSWAWRAAAAAATFALFVIPQTASASTFSLKIKIIYAHSKSKKIDPALKTLAKDFSSLSFTAYELKDEATLSLEKGSAGSVQLPNKEWMVIRALEVAPDGKLRIELQIEKMKFKTTVGIGAGATLAVGGPPFEGGALILAITRPTAKK